MLTQSINTIYDTVKEAILAVNKFIYRLFKKYRKQFFNSSFVLPSLEGKSRIKEQTPAFYDSYINWIMWRLALF